MIRRARFADIPALTALIGRMHDRSIYAEVADVDVPHTKQLLMQLITQDGADGPGGALVVLAETDGRVTGLLAAALDRLCLVGPAHRLRASDLFYYLDPGGDPRDGVRLLDAFVAWAEANPHVVEMYNGMTDTIGDSARVARLYERRGFTRHGLIYRKELAR